MSLETRLNVFFDRIRLFFLREINQSINQSTYLPTSILKKNGKNVFMLRNSMCSVYHICFMMFFQEIQLKSFLTLGF